MWTTDYEWFGILSSISNPYSTFYDSTYLFDYCCHPFMTICDINLSWRCLYSGEWYPSYNELHSDNLSKPSFSLGYIQHHSLCEHHHNETGFVYDLWLFYQQPTSEWSSLSLTCQRNTTCNLYCFQTTLKYHLPTHSLCFLDTIIPPNQHHSTEYPKP